MYWCRQHCAMQNRATRHVFMCNIGRQFSHFTNLMQQLPTAPQCWQPGTKMQLQTKQNTTNFVFLVLFAIVLPHAVVFSCMKTTSLQALQLHRGATNCVTKVIAHISQKNQVLQLKLWEIRQHIMLFKGIFLFFSFTLSVVNRTNPPEKLLQDWSQLVC